MKIACIQMNSGNDMAANIATFEQRVAEAAKAGAALITTPENTFMMDSWNPKEKIVPKHRYTQARHPGIEVAVMAAKKHKVWLLIGGVAVLPDDGTDKGKTYNRSLLINPEGKIQATYDKMHLFDVEVGDGQAYKESERYLAGGQPVVTDIGSAKLGLSVCYDVRFPCLYRQLAMMGADIITVPSAFVQVTGEAHWHVLLRARAIENGCFVIAPAQVGTHPGGRKTYGHSLVVDPWGRVLADGGDKEGIIYADIDISEVANTRKKIPSLAHCKRSILSN